MTNQPQKPDIIYEINKISYEQQLVAYAYLDQLVKDPRKFGEFVRNRLEELGMTKSYLANKIGCTYQTIDHYVHDKSFPRSEVNILPKLLLHLEISSPCLEGLSLIRN